MAEKPSTLRALSARLGRWLIGRTGSSQRIQTRTYGAARGSRSTGGFGGFGGSADAELNASLTVLRNRSRQMVRDSSYAKRAKKVVVNNVIGAGVGMQAQVGTTRGALNDRINADIESAWSDWCGPGSAHTGGKLHFCDLERVAFGQIFEAGEVLVRVRLSRFGDSKVPLALELIEPERLAHEAIPVALDPTADIRMGVEVDAFQRPVAYWIRERHPGDLRIRGNNVSERYERVPADEIFHVYVVERWPQSRGEPWLHTALRKLDDLNEYTGLEVTAARGSAQYFATITTPDADTPSLKEDDQDAAGNTVMDLEPLTIQELAPGEELQFHAPNRPNSALDPFMRAMLREIAAGTGVSYESLSRDYSQSNYSSSRLALIDDRELYRVLQQWWIRNFRMPLHRLWLQQAVLSGAIPSIPVQQYAIDRMKFEAVLFKPRGWSWVDPTKEVTAYKEAIKAGLTTLTDVIAATGGGQDIEDVVKTRRRELDMLAEAEIESDCTVPDPALATTPSPPPQQPQDAPPDGATDGEGDTTDAARARVVPIARTA